MKILQDWVDWAFAVGVFLVLIAIVLLLVRFLSEVSTNEPCDSELEARTFQCISLQVVECVESDLYTRDECIALVGGEK